MGSPRTICAKTGRSICGQCEDGCLFVPKPEEAASAERCPDCGHSWTIHNESGCTGWGDGCASKCTTPRARQEAVPLPQRWKIRIAGYGTFDFNGNEVEAEDMRSGKAQWEHGSGIKWCVSDPTEIDKLTELMAWYFDNNSGCPLWLFKARAKAIKEARKSV